MNSDLRLLGAVAALTVAALVAAGSLSAQGTPPAQGAAAAMRPATGGWTSDRRELAVGDVITLYVDEAAIASARKTQTGRDNTARDMDFSLATPGAPATGAGFSTAKRASSDQTGDMGRSTSFQTTVSVRVVARNPDGSYQVKGMRALDIDKNSQEISVEGVLRPQDVTVHNEANGNRLADAKITVKQKGKLGKTRGGIFGRIFGLLWP